MGLSWVAGFRRWARLNHSPSGPVIGLALGGGFARGIAHIGVLRALEQHNIPIGMIAGVSAGSIVAAAYASGTPVDEIARMGRAMRFKDIAQWTISRLGLAASERMNAFLMRLLKVHRFEEMRIPLAVVATDLSTGQPAIFRDQGDVLLPVRASCSYPGLFQPVKHGEHYLVDGAMTMEVPAAVLRQMGASRVISVCLPVDAKCLDTRNMFQVITRCFQIMQRRQEWHWRKQSSVVIEPDVLGMKWDCFESAGRLIESGERATRAVIPRLLNWLGASVPEAA